MEPSRPIETFTKTYYPHWMKPHPIVLDPTPPPLPGWLSPPQPPPLKQSPEARALMLVEFEAAMPWVLERICGGATLEAAIALYPTPLDPSAFTRWMMKDPERKALYAEAKEVRAETWTGVMVKHALGETMADLDRSKTIIDTLKWLIARHARKEYGDTKTIEMNTTINIRAALQEANERVIEARVIDDDE